MQNIIEIKNIHKAFKANKVLKGVDFGVKKGSIFALLGSNGAGKTTLIRILSTLSNADDGSALICGFDVAKKPKEIRKRISLTGQFAAVDEVLTGRENLILMGKLNHIKNPHKKADELLKEFRLEDAANRAAKEYSGGMKRRLDIAMSLVAKPEIIFLDEPTTGLDPQNRIGMWAMIKELAKNGTTIFLTTQYLDEAENLADDICVLHEGKIIIRGTAEELKNTVPRGVIILEFGSNKLAKKAAEALSEYSAKICTDNPKTIEIKTDASAKEFSKVLEILHTLEADPKTFTQKLPTLEDAFLTLIGEKGE